MLDHRQSVFYEQTFAKILGIMKTRVTMVDVWYDTELVLTGAGRADIWCISLYLWTISSVHLLMKDKCKKIYMELHKQIPLVVCHINIIRSVILSWWAQQNDSFMILNIVPTHSCNKLLLYIYILCLFVKTFIILIKHWKYQT